MKKVLFIAMFAFVVMSLFVGCNSEVKEDTSYLDDYDTLKNAVNDFDPILHNWWAVGSEFNTPTELTTKSNLYYTFVSNNGCGTASFEVIKADGKFIVTTNTDMTTTYSDLTLKVTEDIEVKISATDFDGNSKTLTIKMDKDSTIETEYVGEGSIIKNEQTMTLLKDGVKNVVEYEYEYDASKWVHKSSAIVNNREVKSSLSYSLIDNTHFLYPQYT